MKDGVWPVPGGRRQDPADDGACGLAILAHFKDGRLAADLMLASGAADGVPQPIDIGPGPMFIKLKWLSETV